MGDRWGDPGVGELRQWNYNSDPTSGNKTVMVEEGGYCIYLNDTVKIDVTTQWPQGGWQEEYLIMTNGTILNVQWFNDRYITELNNETYQFWQVLTYYNLTDSGIIYNIADPYNSDPYQIYTPTMYSIPAINTDQSSWLRMNTTTDMVLQDGLGYYLINSTDQGRIDLETVDVWWNYTEEIRRSLFKDQWELEKSIPRYNATINGQKYFVLDPSPVTGRWENEWDIENNVYRYPTSLEVILDGENYQIDLLENNHWKPDLRRRRIETMDYDGSLYEVEEQHHWKPSYQVIIDEQSAEIKLEDMNVYKRHTIWGEIYHWTLTNMEVYSLRSTCDIVLGTPEWGLWGIRAFTMVPDTGAVDLDGDLATTNDQYYVRRLHEGTDTWNRTEDRMFVEIVWDPNASMIDDEIHISSWMGKVHTEWSFTWNKTYTWYYASNMSRINSVTMEEINNTIIDSVTGKPKPGYWDIAHMITNSTWSDLLEKAEMEGWNWIKDNTYEWDWIWFGTQQDFVTAWSDMNGTETAGIGLRYELAGLSLYNETKQTHYYMVENVSSTSFVSPGEAFGNLNNTGEMIIALNQTVSFGVSFENLTGTLFPYKQDRSMWGWWDSPIYGADYNEPNFMNKPTTVMIDEVAFKVNFNAETLEDSLNNDASMKIDQHIGQWTVEPHVIDGRKTEVNNVSQYLTGNDVLLNRSLAINYYVTAYTAIAWEVYDERGGRLNNNNVTESSRFDVAARLSNVSFASVKLGSVYDWQKPITQNDTVRTLNVTSKTMPIGSFEASYKSDSGKSSTGFDINAMMYFLTVGFDRWDGYAVYNDPELAFYAYKGIPAGIGINLFQHIPAIILATLSVIIVIPLILYRKRITKTLTSIMRREYSRVNS
jgi:hypothetical protein